MAMYNNLECSFDSHSSPHSWSVDESSPLLTEPFSHVPAHPVREEQEVEDSIHNDNKESTSKLVYVMVGLWIGTFCAGLGKPQRGL